MVVYWDLMGFYGGLLGSNGIYPLVNVYIANWKDPPFLMGKSTISTGPFSIAMLNYQRVLEAEVTSELFFCSFETPYSRSHSRFVTD